MKFLSAWALQSLQLYPHPHAGTHAPLRNYICTTLHTHTHTPLHNLTHTVVTPTHAHPSSYIGTTCAHPSTYLQISIAYNCHNTYLQISANIHTCIHLQISSHTTVPINCTNAQIVVVNLTVQKSSKSIVCQLQYIHSFYSFLSFYFLFFYYIYIYIYIYQNCRNTNYTNARCTQQQGPGTLRANLAVLQVEPKMTQGTKRVL